MGACVSSSVVVHQISKPKPPQMGDASKPASFVIASPIGEKPASLLVSRPMPEELVAKYRLSSAQFRSYGSSKEAVFFDSQPCLESDDDFYSVNGDFTPSCTPLSGNTPSHRSTSATPPHPTDTTVADYKLAQSPAKRRKSLSELFKESEDEEGSNEETDEDTTELSSDAGAAKSVTFAPHICHIPEPKSTNDVEVKKKRSRKSAQHCLPKLFSVCSPNSAKKNVVGTGSEIPRRRVE